MLNGTMVTVSIHYRSQSKTNTSGTVSDDPDSPTSSTNPSVSQDDIYERHASLTPLANMSTARCGFGLCSLKGKLIACGRWQILCEICMHDEFIAIL